jgi:hypothetical protein
MTGDDFAAFMGMWLAEGSVTWHGNSGKPRRPTIYVTQARSSRGYMPYRDLLTRLLGREEVKSILEERGTVEVNCEFCNRRYAFDPVDAEQVFAAEIVTGAGTTRH